MNRSFTISKLLAGAGVALATIGVARIASAEQPPPPPPGEAPVDVVVSYDKAVPHRTLTIEFNPLSLWIRRVSASAVITPGNHHALVISPFYSFVNTFPYATGIDGNGYPLVDTTGKLTGQPGSTYTLNVLGQSFTGLGTELGYRYYFENGGPRGLFLGPSLIAGWISATAGDGSTTSFMHLGVAADVGYQVLVVDRMSISLGAGLQYSFATKSIPDQQQPARVLANSGLWPRMLLSFGYAF